MDLLTVARRANLGSNVRAYFKIAKDRLAAGVSYSKTVTTSTLKSTESEFYESTYIIGLVTVAEALVTDLATEYLACYPGHLKEKTFSLDLVDEYGSVATAIKSLAEKTVNDWSYGKFSDLVKKTITLFNTKASLDPALMDEISEIKATRDLYVHANGIANKTYLYKSGALARARVGHKLELGRPYLEKVERALHRFVDALERLVPDKIKSMGRATAFRAMWDATQLAKMVPFDEGWTVESEDMVRPNEDGLARGWSHSEKMLLDFFLGVYSEDYEARKYDVMSALRRFSPASNEGKVISSWASSPFWF
jgi:hypothetical protein